MKVVRTLDELQAAVSELEPLGFVPTMGALHPGHISLLSAAKLDGRRIAASIFVNPKQFAPGEDFNRYPRDEAGDLDKLEASGCDLVWLPDAAIMYPEGSATTVSVAGPALLWEGAARPTHFAGVATVVAKLFGQVRPAAAYFGEKDWQQIQVITRMVKDLLLPVQIVPVPTARDVDGLALSSRNRFLQPAERAAAPALYRALNDASAAIAAGGSVSAAVAKARRALVLAGLEPDYVALVRAHGMEPLDALEAPARLIAAARLGTVRLLDNIAVTK